MKSSNSRKCIVLFSGGLDSRIAIKIMQEKGFEVLAVFFKLPFVKENFLEIKKFCKENSLDLKVFNCTKGELLQEYLEILKKPFFNRGKGYNPCIDCKIFILKKTKVFADKNNIDLIVTGDVLDERPLSQNKKTLKKIEEAADIKGRILRPLSAKNLEELEVLNDFKITKEDFYDIQGRRRQKQLALANSFQISYPNPSGGCLLCEPQLKNRFKELLKRKISEKQIFFLNIGRQFIIKDSWIVIGRNEKENKIIESFYDKEKIIVPYYPAPSAVILDNFNKNIKGLVSDLIKAYSKKGSEKERVFFEKYKL